VPPHSPRYLSGGLEEPGRVEKLKLALPAKFRVQPIGPKQTLSGMLAAGEIDALHSARAPSTLRSRPNAVRRLFKDFVSVEREYFRRTRIFPIMHTVVIRRELYRKHPWVAGSLTKAFAAAQRKFGDRVTLFRARVGHDVIPDLGKFDVVFAVGVLHHLTDDEAVALFEVAKSALRPLGHFVSVDACWAEGQSWLARAFIALDRGRFVRTADGYSTLGARVFRTCTAELRHDLLRIPYTHLILSCRP